MKIEDEKSVAPQSVVRTDAQRAPERQPRQRIPFGVPRQKMSVIADLPGYFLAWINDDGGRIEEAQMGGYEFTAREEIIMCPGVTPANSDSGSKVSMIVGKTKEGGPMRAYLMKIRVEWKEEAREILRDLRRKRIETIKRGQMGLNGAKGIRPVSHSPISLSVTDKP